MCIFEIVTNNQQKANKNVRVVSFEDVLESIVLDLFS
jgi:hypothetical protein